VEWFYYAIKPKVHYYPINANLSDLLEAVDYLEAHQDEAQRIIAAANNISAEFFTLEKIQQETLKVFR